MAPKSEVAMPKSFWTRREMVAIWTAMEKKAAALKKLRRPVRRTCEGMDLSGGSRRVWRRRRMVRVKPRAIPMI
jgi:hypothetical protein